MKKFSLLISLVLFLSLLAPSLAVGQSKEPLCPQILTAINGEFYFYLLENGVCRYANQESEWFVIESDLPEGTPYLSEAECPIPVAILPEADKVMHEESYLDFDAFYTVYSLCTYDTEGYASQLNKLEAITYAVQERVKTEETVEVNMAMTYLLWRAHYLGPTNIDVYSEGVNEQTLTIRGFDFVLSFVLPKEGEVNLALTPGFEQFENWVQELGTMPILDVDKNEICHVGQRYVTHKPYRVGELIMPFGGEPSIVVFDPQTHQRAFISVSEVPVCYKYNSGHA